jgi:hypothetical protein
MARIEIRDLEESIELDSIAMATIIGGKSHELSKRTATRRNFDRLNPAWLVRLINKESLLKS